ncbi:HAD-like domain-containing protein [Podospora aff. communis PSN243]|uniref:HAD-like domain-containing protein n=1 Tax=Podospora aff. communis PSN243 TaxID=3040156 RepID=A0AAV9GZA0_9PEZI|nr:HAD-like domain-containing protein [Podospora aff. communis PSN243]
MGSTGQIFEYSAPPQQFIFDGFLFDMDGTIIDSTAAVEKHWEAVGNEIGVSHEVILQTSHGRRSIDILKILCPEKATWEYVQHMEGLLPLNHAESAIEIPGARSLLASLISLSAPWAIVTSGSIPLVTGWLKVLNLPTPEHLITAESVTNGKPDPACYRMGRERLGLVGDEKQLLVLEDAPAGIKAGKAAGCVVVGLVTSHGVEEVLAAGPDYVVRDLESVRVVRAEGGRVVVEVRDGLVVKGV